MQIGTLVRWIGQSNDYGSVGVVSRIRGNLFWVTWADGCVVDYVRGNTHAKKMEVLLCE